MTAQLAATLVGALLAAPTAPLALEPGPYAVGFRVMRRAGDSPRPVQVAVWFPAAARGRPLRYGDYVRAAAGERSAVPLDETAVQAALAAYRSFLEGNGVPAAGVDEWMVSTMLAADGVRPTRGSFPVVLLAGGMGGALNDQAALAEHLASHGYVVATTPSPVRLGVRMESEEDVLPMAREQERDLELALEAVAGERFADPRRVAVVGYSFGARPALLLAAHHPGLRALVSLDGGIGAHAAREWLAGAGLDREALALPILHVWQDDDDTVTPDFELLESLRRAPRTLVKVEGLRHMDLITYGVARSRLPSMGAKDGGALAARLSTVFALARASLDAHLKDRPRRWRSLLAGRGKHPARLLEIRTIPAASR